jgi:hypothetical protein
MCRFIDRSRSATHRQRDVPVVMLLMESETWTSMVDCSWMVTGTQTGAQNSVAQRHCRASHLIDSLHSVPPKPSACITPRWRKSASGDSSAGKTTLL